MKPVVVFAIAFVVATAASTGAKVMLTKPAAAKPTADSTHADSTAHDSTKAAKPDSTKSATDTAVVASGAPVTPPTDTLRKPAADSVKTVKTPAQLAAAVTAAAAAAAPAPDTASEHRVAKVFTSMDAKQAAKVLEHMSDNDVKVILGYVGVKQAATIMAALPPERVAKLSALSTPTASAGGKSK